VLSGGAGGSSSEVKIVAQASKPRLQLFGLDAALRTRRHPSRLQSFRPRDCVQPRVLRLILTFRCPIAFAFIDIHLIVRIKFLCACDGFEQHRAKTVLKDRSQRFKSAQVLNPVIPLCFSKTDSDLQVVIRLGMLGSRWWVEMRMSQPRSHSLEVADEV
jgi:hypothetical protein